jgi:hypothetical protein
MVIIRHFPLMYFFDVIIFLVIEVIICDWGLIQSAHLSESWRYFYRLAINIGSRTSIDGVWYFSRFLFMVISWVELWWFILLFFIFVCRLILSGFRWCNFFCLWWGCQFGVLGGCRVLFSVISTLIWCGFDAYDENISMSKNLKDTSQVFTCFSQLS